MQSLLLLWLLFASFLHVSLVVSDVHHTFACEKLRDRATEQNKKRRKEIRASNDWTSFL